jgi:hypothetical protein
MGTPGRIYVIPDIHGCYTLLAALWAKLLADEHLDLNRDKVIFLGDLIDRGPDSRLVLEFVQALQQRNPENVIVLRGNHEEFMIRAWHHRSLSHPDYSDVLLWLANSQKHGQVWENGGKQTLLSFHPGSVAEALESIPSGLIAWIESRPVFHREYGFFFSHAPVLRDEFRPVRVQGKPLAEADYTWSRARDPENLTSRTHDPESDGTPVVGVCGHQTRYSEGIQEPRVFDNYIFLDSGCGCWLTAPLTAMEVRSRKVIAVYPPK